MIVDARSLRDLFQGFSTSFNKGIGAAPSKWDKIAMKIPSSAAGNNYSWLTDFPGIREWIGDRIVHSLSAARYVVDNKEFELTVSVKRKDIEDDQYGIYGKRFEGIGYETAMHPDDLVFSLLAQGDKTKCFDGQYFFDTDHPSYDAEGKEISASNFTAGAGPAWYLIDGSKPLMPMIYQERQPFLFEQITNNEDSYVFLKGEYLYGTRGRSNAGFGLWQLAYGSKAELTVENFVAAKVAMASYRRASGKKLGITPTHLVVPTELEEKARQIINATLINGGESNVWAGSVELVVPPFL
ncbi:Mu-like prophage major head subunit gpT family protein [Ochrobactrum intermedium]|uniref:Mu-like prophage major head subunit gpT family protein n=1 Tax=Brucella intermedia TaxID=94625 RepID=UPI00159C0BE9|nr:Mu-like prophage major head subunit gpT family protein [Brucella intermedia]NVM42748.1 Mu-like prophage major head subunit gpT family protein [Brucella intermedia]